MAKSLSGNGAPVPRHDGGDYPSLRVGTGSTPDDGGAQAATHPGKAKIEREVLDGFCYPQSERGYTGKG